MERDLSIILRSLLSEVSCVAVCVVLQVLEFVIEDLEFIVRKRAL